MATTTPTSNGLTRAELLATAEAKGWPVVVWDRRHWTGTGGDRDIWAAFCTLAGDEEIATVSRLLEGRHVRLSQG